jgi:hypothetical protein
VLNIPYNILCGGQRLEYIEVRRNNEVFLNALGTESIPDPMTAGDFCRRFNERSIENMMEAINKSRLTFRPKQPKWFTRQTARIDANGSIVETLGECKKRKHTYEQAQQRHPERWSRGTRAWDRVELVTLNPSKKREKADAAPKPTARDRKELARAA